MRRCTSEIKKIPSCNIKSHIDSDNESQTHLHYEDRVKLNYAMKIVKLTIVVQYVIKKVTPHCVLGKVENDFKEWLKFISHSNAESAVILRVQLCFGANLSIFAIRKKTNES